MAKKRVRVTVLVGPMIPIYLDFLLKRGMHGDTPEDVARRMLCDGIIAALPPGTMRELVEQQQARQRARRRSARRAKR